jgi:hypothetical protein
MKKKEGIIQKVWNLKFIIILVALIIVFAVLYVDFSKVNPFKKNKYFELNDVCGVIPGGTNVMHTVNNEEECDVQCYNQCASGNLKKVKSIFTLIENKCNKCSCACR